MGFPAVAVCLLFYFTSCSVCSPIEDELDIRTAEPDYLDHLLATKQYEEFGKLVQIDNIDLIRPATDNASSLPMYNKDLQFGDIVFTPKQKEQARQGLRLDKYRGNKWPGVVPFSISDEYGQSHKDAILSGVNTWNSQVGCIKWRPRNRETDYVHFFPGNGCYSNLGKTGRQQTISLQRDGCFRQGTIVHEMDHAVGFSHEHNRHDRDNFVKVLKENIDRKWQSQYDKNDPNDFGLQQHYDYESVMHYPMNAPGSNLKAFQILKSGVNERNIGQRNGFTRTDIQKIQDLYC